MTRKILLISQVFPPDPASVGQHLRDAAIDAASAGAEVLVLTSRSGYDDPSVRYGARETLGSVEIERLTLASFGKRSILQRVAGAVSFVLQAFARGLCEPGVDTVFVSTSPPIAPVMGALLAALKVARLKVWLMDLNPEQVVANGALSPSDWRVKVLAYANRHLLDGAEVCTLDRYMEQTLIARNGSAPSPTHIAPPWTVVSAAVPVRREDNPFRRRHGIGDRIAVMYSGNHSPVHPLDTVLGAARELEHDARFVFVFVGGGAAKEQVECAQLRNIMSLPYQPERELPVSLSAADIHVVLMGDAMVGVVHPCKIYGAMAVERPILYVGPQRSHVADIIGRDQLGWSVRHGNVRGVVEALDALALMNPADRTAMGRRALEALQRDFAPDRLRADFRSWLLS